MKQFIIFSLLLCILQNKFLLAQEGVLFGYKEIYTFTENVNSNDTIYFNLQAVGNVWAWDESPPYEIATTYNGHSIIENGLIVIGSYSGPEKGWNNLIPNGTHNPPYFSHGFYKFTVKKNYNGSIIYFYINFRDSDWDGSSYPCGNDIDLYYNGSNNSLRISWCGGDTTTKSVSNGQIFNFWTEKGKTNVSTNKFSNFWQNCLVVIPKKGQDTVLVPHIIWGPIPNFQADGYKIYWSLNTQGGPPGNFSLLAIVGANTYEYTHEGLAANGNWKAYYKVKAYNSTSESGFTNTAEIGVGGFFKDKGYAYTDNNNEFTLLSNFPNPFNPVTNIKFHLPASSVADRQAGIPKTNHVTLKVFDLLGREVAILINEPKQVGEYEIEFNASKYGLTSGVYLYQLRCYDFLQTKKFILMK